MFSLNVSSTLYQHRLSGYLGLNQQLYDLGQNASDLYDRAETEQMIKTIELNFNLESNFIHNGSLDLQNIGHERLFLGFLKEDLFYFSK